MAHFAVSRNRFGTSPLPGLPELLTAIFQYGIGVLQTLLYFQWWPADKWTIKLPVSQVLLGSPSNGFTYVHGD